MTKRRRAFAALHESAAGTVRKTCQLLALNGRRPVAPTMSVFGGKADVNQAQWSRQFLTQLCRTWRDATRAGPPSASLPPVLPSRRVATTALKSKTLTTVCAGRPGSHFATMEVATRASARRERVRLSLPHVWLRANQLGRVMPKKNAPELTDAERTKRIKEMARGRSG
jgi:hypothetical protein